MDKSIVSTEFNLAHRKITLSKSEVELYDHIKYVFSSKLEEVTNNSEYYNYAIVGLKRLIQAVSHPANLPDDLFPKGLTVNNITASKLKELEKLVSEVRQRKEKIVIFAIFQKTIDAIVEMTGKSKTLVIRGDTPKSERGKIVSEFQNSNTKDVIVLSLGAGNSGLTLTAANNVVMYDLWWNPAIESQAFARVYRKGQTKPVTAYRIIADKTIDDNILKKLSYKKTLINTLGDGKSESNAKQLIKEVFQ